MALRKLRKTLKPIIWLMTGAFLISIFLIGAGSAVGKREAIAFKVNKEKVMIDTLERSIYQNIEAQREYYKDKIDEDYIKLMTVNSMIENSLISQGAKKLHVGVAGKEVKEKYLALIADIGEKEAAIRIRESMNITVDQFKDLLKKDLLVQKTKEKIESQYKATDEEIKEEFENNKFVAYKGKTLDEVKEKIKTSLETKNGAMNFSKWLEDERAKAKIEKVDSRYERFMKKTVIKLNDREIDNLSFSGKTFYSIALMGKDKKEAYESAIEDMKKETVVIMEAKARGLKANEKATEETLVIDLTEKLKKDIKSKYKLSDEELKTYFEKNNKKYETKESAKVKHIRFELKASEADIKASEEKAKEVLTKAMTEGADFAELAKEYSQGPTATKGGDLGWFEKGAMVPEFEAAAFKGEKGKVYPELVKTRFGYHIIKVDDVDAAAGKVKASHILIKEEASEGTKMEIKSKAEQVLADIQAGKLEFDKAVDENSGSKEEREITRGRTPNKEVNDAAFAMGADEIKLVESKDGFYIIDQTKYTPYKEAVLEEVKENVVFDLLNEISTKEIEKLKEELKDKVELTVLDESIKTVLAKTKETK